MLDPYLQPFWNWTVSKTPDWIHPNVLTLTGLIVNITTSLILVYLAPDGNTDLPGWSTFLFALGLFIYQTLDAIDGKQARRTNTSGPLGELFDHGCDAISTVFVAIATCVAVKLGEFSSWMLYQSIASSILFYCAHWQTYVTGELKFGAFDVTEAQFVIMFLHLLTALLGTQIWTSTLKLPIVYAITFSAIFPLFAYFKVILAGGAGKGGSSIAHTSILSPLLPLGVIVVPGIVICKKSPLLLEQNPCLYLLMFSLAISKPTIKLVVAHMTKSEISTIDSVLVGPSMLFLNQYFNTFINERIVLWAALIWTAADLLTYATRVCIEISNHLNINIFTISPRPPSRVENNGRSERRQNTGRDSKRRHNYSTRGQANSTVN